MKLVLAFMGHLSGIHIQMNLKVETRIRQMQIFTSLVTSLMKHF